MVEPGACDAVELSLVIPTLNECANIRPLLRDVHSVLAAAPLRGYEVIVVDDDSADETWRAAAALSVDHPWLRVVRRRGERGVAMAVVRGWQAARGEILGTINADFQHPPSVLGALIAALDEADVAVATRYAAGGGDDMTWPRRLASRAARAAGRIALPEVVGRVSDPLSGCYLFHRRVIAGIVLCPSGYKSLIEILARGRAMRIRECPYAMSQRASGRSNMRLRHWAEYLIQLRRLRAAWRRR
jgi:dolichol-phosphate mannosyltransferase